MFGSRRPMDSSYTTVLCNRFFGEQGRCPYGLRCKFAHDLSEVGLTGAELGRLRKGAVIAAKKAGVWPQTPRGGGAERNPCPAPRHAPRPSRASSTSPSDGGEWVVERRREKQQRAKRPEKDEETAKARKVRHGQQEEHDVNRWAAAKMEADNEEAEVEAEREATAKVEAGRKKGGAAGREATERKAKRHPPKAEQREVKAKMKPAKARAGAERAAKVKAEAAEMAALEAERRRAEEAKASEEAKRRQRAEGKRALEEARRRAVEARFGASASPSHQVHNNNNMAKLLDLTPFTPRCCE